MAGRQGVVAWTLCAASVVGAGAQAAFLASLSGPLLTADNFRNAFPIIGVAAVAFAAVGALIVSRYPGHPIGWLFSIGGFGTALGLAVAAYGAWARRGHFGPVWTAQLAAWVGSLFSAVYSLALVAILLLLVPDGRLLSRRWRPALALPIAGLALHVAALLSISPAQVPADERTAPHYGALTVVLELASNVLLLLALPVAGVALVSRLRAARGEQRQQLRWIATSAVALAAGALVATVPSALSRGGLTPWYAYAPLELAFASLPVCTGVAILRYRLYDIDLIINRAVVLAVLATFVTAGYVAVVVLVGAALGGQVEGKFWSSLLALAVVALAFQPMRKRVLRWADRLVYGQRALPYEALADFSRQLGVAATPSELLPLFAEAAARGVGARSARVQVDVPGTAGLSASWPAGPDSEPDLRVPITDRGELMGLLAVTMPPGRPLRREEQRLLERFAEQAGLALRNVRLEAELRARLDETARQSSALEASRRRLLGARDTERQRVAATINRTVVACLEQVVPALESDWQAGQAEAAEVLRRFDAATSATLHELREVTQGLFPGVLARRGLVPALRAHLGKAGRADVLRVQDPVEHSRFSPATEAAAYFCCVAALEDMVRPACLELALRDGLLILDVTGTRDRGRPDPNRGGPAEERPRPAERTFLADRVEAIGGRIRHDRGPNGEHVLHAELPAALLSGA